MEPTAGKMIPKGEKKLNRLSISAQDFQKSLDYLSELNKYKYGSLVYEALLLSAIIAYARPFSNNEREKVAKSEARLNVADFQLNEKEQKLHVLIITLRNKAVAHAEWDYHPTGVANNSVLTAIPFSVWQYFNNGDAAKFLELSVSMLDKIQHMRADIMHRKRLGVD